MCSDGTEYRLTKPSDNTYDFGLINHKEKEVNCVYEYYLEDCLYEGRPFLVGRNKYKKTNRDTREHMKSMFFRKDIFL